MTESDLVAALRPVAGAFDALGVRYYRGGSPEDTVLAKLEWFRLGGETSERQWWDVVGILRVTEGADHAYLRRWAAALSVADLLERALADAAS